MCGDSVHWFDWPITFARFAQVLGPFGLLAIVQREWATDAGVHARLRGIYTAHGANPDFQPLDPVAELECRGLFARTGRHLTAPVAWSPTVDALIACHHSQNGFVIEKMRDPGAFDREIAGVLTELVDDTGRVPVEVQASVVWGQPLAVRP